MIFAEYLNEWVLRHDKDSPKLPKQLGESSSLPKIFFYFLKIISAVFFSEHIDIRIPVIHHIPGIFIKYVPKNISAARIAILVKLFVSIFLVFSIKFPPSSFLFLKYNSMNINISQMYGYNLF